MQSSLVGKVALVTGATRGIGKGIALQLSQNGATVYITGRTLKPKPNSTGSLEDTQKEIEKRGGKCIPVACDHENDKQIEGLFKQIESEQKGKLDILVNNAYKGVDAIFSSMKQKFWETDGPKTWDDINNVGLRNHYICTVHASRLMVPRKQGLIVNISSLGGQSYLFNVAYGIGKAAVDRMAIDCGIELKKHNVACLSLMLGAVRTEKTTDMILNSKNDNLKLKGSSKDDAMSAKKVFEEGETVEFGGKLISHMATNPKIMRESCKIVVSADYATKHNILDIDGRRIPCHRELSQMGGMFLPKPLRPLAKMAPSSLKVPQFMIDIALSKYK